MNKVAMRQSVFRALDPVEGWVSKESLQEMIERGWGRKFFPFDTTVFNETIGELDFCGYVRKTVLCETELFQITEAERAKWCLFQGKVPEVDLPSRETMLLIRWKASRMPHDLNFIPDPRNLHGNGVRNDVEQPYVSRRG